MTEHLQLIDSSVWIRLFRRPPHAELASRVDEILRQGRAATNGVIRLEIVSGARNEREFDDYSETLHALIQLAIGDQTWTQAARLGYQMRRLGITASTPDLIISASAMEHRAVLIHADADFDRIAAKADIRVESFTNAS